jgi:hypothetical protein
MCRNSSGYATWALQMPSECVRHNRADGVRSLAVRQEVRGDPGWLRGEESAVVVDQGRVEIEAMEADVGASRLPAYREGELMDVRGEISQAV